MTQPADPPPTMMRSKTRLAFALTHRPAGTLYASKRKDRDEDMQRSEHRILTTHAGSLPRPAELTRSSRGAPSAKPWMRARDRDAGPRGRARHRAKQIETGLDVIDDGEQSRESFVLYMRQRLTGLGGDGSRPMHADLDAYPQYKASSSSAPRRRDTGVEPRAICRRRSARSAIPIRR